MWNSFVDLLGLCGNIGFGASCLPMAWKAFRTGKNMGIPVSSIWMFLFALSTFYGYLLLHYGFDPFTSIIGFVEIACWATVGRYHYFPRRDLSGNRDRGFDFGKPCSNQDRGFDPIVSVRPPFVQRTKCALDFGKPCGPDDCISCDCDGYELPHG